MKSFELPLVKCLGMHITVISISLNARAATDMPPLRINMEVGTERVIIFSVSLPLEKEGN